MTTLRSRIIRLAHQQPALRPHLIPLLKNASDDDDITEEEEAFVLWNRVYRRRQEALLRKWEARYDREIDAIREPVRPDVDELKGLIRFWFWERSGNYLETPGEEAPNFEGAASAMFHRRRKALLEVADVKKRIIEDLKVQVEARIKALNDLNLFGDDFLNALYDELDEYKQGLLSR